MSFRNRWAILTFVLGLFLTLVAVAQLRQSNNDRIDAAVSTAAHQALDQVLERVRLYQYGLRGARGAVQTAGEWGISRELFVRYSATRNIDEEFPGARGFGFIRRVPASQVEVMVERARRDGWPEFSVRELAPHDGERFIIEYIEPVERNRQAVGLDIASEIHRRMAAEAALRTGMVQLTGPITLVQATGSPLQSFLILMPVYRGGATPATIDERLAQGYGWSYAALLMKEVLADLGLDPQLAHLELFDVTNPADPERFFDSSEGLASDLPHVARLVLGQEVFGRNWEARFSVHPEFVARLHLLDPLPMFGVGCLISLLVAALVGSSNESRRNRYQILEEKAKLAAIVEGSGDAIIGCDLAGVVTSWNRGAELVLGYSAAEALGISIMDLIVPPELAQEELDILHRIAMGDPVPHFDTERLRKDGRRLPVSITVSPIMAANGSVIGASKTVRDIAPQKAQELRIIELNTRLESQVAQRTAELGRVNVLLGNVMQAATEVAIIATDRDGVITLFNRGAERMLGYRAEETIGRQTPARFHLESEVSARAAELHREYQEVIEGFRVFVHKPALTGSEAREWTYVRKDGSHFPVALVVTSMRNEAGDLIGFLGIATDITDQRKQSAELMAARDQLLMAADIAELGIWTWTPADNSLQWNDKMFELYQQPLSLRQQGLRFEHWSSRLLAEDLPRTLASLERAARGESVYNATFRIRHPDGTIRYIQAGGHAEQDASGQVVRVLGINRDVTAQQELESWLRHAKEQADAASAAKSSFLANMSHEIRTPMNAILGMLQLVQQTGLNARQDDYISKARTAARSLLRLINDILDYSKIDAGKLELDRHPFEPENLMQELAAVLAGNQGEKPVELVFDLDTRLPIRMLGDELRLQQILINLASNALKFTVSGQVRVQMQQLGRDLGQCRVRIMVEDTGIGISDEQLQRIFEGFSQAETSTARRFGGSGLGLVISKQLVAMMGGELQVRSEAGKGSCFWFDISLSMADARPWLNQPLYPNRRWRALLVEGNRDNRRVLGRYLEELGAEVQAVGNYQDAAGRLWQSGGGVSTMDLVLIDSDLLGNNLPAFVRQLVQAGCRHLLLLNKPGAELGPRANAGIFEGMKYRQVSRPVTPSQLALAVRKLLRGEVVAEAEQAAVTRRRLANVRILLVEDNAFNRQVAAELLASEGASVAVACGGLEGVTKVLEQPAAQDLVLMDMQMPDIDGLEASRRIRAAGQTRLPILAMTANVAAEDVRACLAAGMNDHIGKPIELETLVARILYWVRLAEESGSADPVASAELAVVADELPDSGAVIDQAAALEDPQQGDDTGIDFLESDTGDDHQENILDGVILEYFGGDVGLYRQMLDLFEPNALELLEQLQVALDRQESQGIRAALHTLKGTSNTMGAFRLGHEAGNLESAVRLNPDAATTLVSEVTVRQLRQLLSEELSELSVAMAELMTRQAC